MKPIITIPTVTKTYTITLSSADFQDVIGALLESSDSNRRDIGEALASLKEGEDAE
jgi:hypothetical protein